jgi:hypothetical protein
MVPDEKSQLESLGIDAKIMLKWMLQNQDWLV